MAHDMDLSILSDMHKDAFGFRPRGESWFRYTEMTDEEIYAEMDRLEVIIVESIDEDERRAVKNVAKFEARITEAIELGAADRISALRWLAQADDVELDNGQSVGYFLYLNGISGYKHELPYYEELGFAYC